MIGALGTLFFFAVTPVFASRTARTLGSLRANFWRLLVAAALLGVWAHAFGGGLSGAALQWFVFGGVIGFGVGGIGMFKSLPRIGPTLSTLIVQCLSAVAALAIERLWLGTQLSLAQLGFVGMTLSGVVVGLLPRSTKRPSSSAWRIGLTWALLAALGQGAGAVISRKAFLVAGQAHEIVDPGTAAYQRVLGGIAVAALAMAFTGRRESETPFESRYAARWWVLANALTGPVLGVTCFQWALRTTPAGLVQPIVAAAPLLTIPFAIWIERAELPRQSYYAGCLLAIGGAAGIAMAR